MHNRSQASTEITADAKPGYIFVGALPPPVHGMANVNDAVCDRLAHHDLLLGKNDIGPGNARSRIVHHLHRLTMVLRAAVSIAIRSGPTRGLYLGTDAGAGIYYFAVLAKIASFRRAPVVIHHHSYSYVTNESRLMRLLIRNAGLRQCHVFLCHDMQMRFLERYSADVPDGMVSMVLPNAFMTEPPAPLKKALSCSRVVIGHMSNLSRDKGVTLFLRLTLKLLEANAISGAELAGPILEASLMDSITLAIASSKGQLRYRGAIYGEAKKRFFEDIDVFVFPTQYRHEAQPLVLLEALAHGCPVVTIGRGCITCDHASTESLVVQRDADFVHAAAAWLQNLTALPGTLADAQYNARERAVSYYWAAAQAADTIFGRTLLMHLSE